MARVVRITIQQLSDLMDIPVRRIRYVLDNNIVGPLRAKGTPDRVGRARCFRLKDAAMIVFACDLIQVGLQRKKINAMVARMGYQYGRNFTRIGVDWTIPVVIAATKRIVLKISPFFVVTRLDDWFETERCKSHKTRKQVEHDNGTTTRTAS